MLSVPPNFPTPGCYHPLFTFIYIRFVKKIWALPLVVAVVIVVVVAVVVVVVVVLLIIVVAVILVIVVVVIAVSRLVLLL